MGTQSEQLERKAHQVRARLIETLEELRAGMTPGQVVDQLAEYAREAVAPARIGVHVTSLGQGYARQTRRRLSQRPGDLSPFHRHSPQNLTARWKMGVQMLPPSQPLGLNSNTPPRFRASW
jgi:Protein of unknown function (DUF3618)